MNWSEQLELAWRLLPREFLNTLYMVGVSALCALLIALPLGIFLFLSRPGGLKEKPWLYRLLSSLVNIGRSIPFAILIIALFPFTRLIVGTSIGTTASIVPLTIAAAPFLARLIENALIGLDREIIDAALVMGAETKQIVGKVLLPESLPVLIQGVTLTLITLVGYSAMAGLVGGGGLGKVAIQYGYQRFNGLLMVITLVVLLLLVEAIQWLGNSLARRVLHRRGQ